VAPICPCCN